MALRLQHLVASACAVGSLLASHVPSAGTPVASWSLNGIITSSNPVPATSTATDVTAGSLTLSSALQARLFLDAFVGGGWPLSGAPDTSRYFQFWVATGPGRAIDFENVLFALHNNHSGTSNWQIRSSVDGFATVLA